MKGGLIFVVGLALTAMCVADMAGIDPAIPRDKCGVTIGTFEDETTAIFILGSDRMYYYKYENNSAVGNFSAWISLGGKFKGGPTVVRSADGRLVVIGRGSNNQYWSTYQSSPDNKDSGWTTWTALGSTSFSTDPVATLSSEGFVHVFGKGDDNTLMHKTQYTNNTLLVWTDWTCLGGSLSSQPAVLLDAEGLMHVFVRGPDRALWTKQQIGGQEPRFIKWSEWQSLGGVLASAPRVPISLNTVNLLSIFVRASDKAFWYRDQVASLPTGDSAVDWNDWQSLGGVFASGPSAIINGDGLLETYGRGVDKAIWRKYQSTSSGVLSWSRWTSLRGITSSGPSVRVRSDGLVDVFVRGVDKQIWVKRQFFSGNTTDFEVWRSQAGSVLSEAFMC